MCIQLYWNLLPGLMPCPYNNQTSAIVTIDIKEVLQETGGPEARYRLRKDSLKAEKSQKTSNFHPLPTPHNLISYHTLLTLVLLYIMILSTKNTLRLGTLEVPTHLSTRSRVERPCQPTDSDPSLEDLRITHFWQQIYDKPAWLAYKMWFEVPPKKVYWYQAQWASSGFAPLSSTQTPFSD